MTSIHKKAFNPLKLKSFGLKHNETIILYGTLHHLTMVRYCILFTSENKTVSKSSSNRGRQRGGVV